MIYIGVLIIVLPPAPPGENGPMTFVQQPIVRERDPKMIYRDCEVCGWWGSYETESKAKMGFASHRQWCRRGHGHKVFW